jgi:predicted ATP-grasp superfamily ATP-dependent carboligase
VEWKRDPRDGALKFLEVNARCWGWHSLSAQVVGNLPRLLLEVLEGRRVEPRSPRYGARWVKHVTDVPVAWHLWWRGELAFRDYRRSLQRPVICCEWERGDPWPFFLQWLLVPYLMVKRGY